MSKFRLLFICLIACSTSLAPVAATAVVPGSPGEPGASAESGRCAEILSLSAYREQRERQALEAIRLQLDYLRLNPAYRQALDAASLHCMDSRFAITATLAAQLQRMGFMAQDGRLHPAFCALMAQESDRLAKAFEGYLQRAQPPPSLEQFKQRRLDDRFGY